MPEFVPELGALGAAFVLILIAAGLWIAAELIRQSFGRVPLIGGWVSSNIAGSIFTAGAYVLHWAGSAWGFAVQLFVTIGNWCWRLPFAIIGNTDAIANFAVFTTQWIIPNTANAVRGEAVNLYQQGLNYTTAVRDWASGLVSDALEKAYGYAFGLYQDAVNYTTAVRDWAGGLLSGALAQAYSYAAGLYQQAVNYTTAVRDFAAGEIAAAEATAISHADQLFTAAESDIASVAAGAQAALSSAAAGIIGGIYTDLDAVGNSAVTAAWPDVAGDIGALRGVLGNDFPDIQALLPWLAGAGVAGLSGVLIRSLAGSAAITRLATDCIVPNCRNLSGLGNDLASLLGDASTAAMLAWFIFLVTDPGGWAAETNAAAGPVTGTVLAAGSRLVGGP